MDQEEARARCLSRPAKRYEIYSNKKRNKEPRQSARMPRNSSLQPIEESSKNAKHIYVYNTAWIRSIYQVYYSKVDLWLRWFPKLHRCTPAAGACILHILARRLLERSFQQVRKFLCVKKMCQIVFTCMFSRIFKTNKSTKIEESKNWLLNTHGAFACAYIPLGKSVTTLACRSRSFERTPCPIIINDDALRYRLCRRDKIAMSSASHAPGQRAAAATAASERRLRARSISTKRKPDDARVQGTANRSAQSPSQDAFGLVLDVVDRARGGQQATDTTGLQEQIGPAIVGHHLRRRRRGAAVAPGAIRALDAPSGLESRQHERDRGRDRAALAVAVEARARRGAQADDAARAPRIPDGKRGSRLQVRTPVYVYRLYTGIERLPISSDYNYWSFRNRSTLLRTIARRNRRRASGSDLDGSNRSCEDDEDLVEEIIDSISLVASRERASRHVYRAQQQQQQRQHQHEPREQRRDSNDLQDDWCNELSVERVDSSRADEQPSSSNVNDNETLVIQQSEREASSAEADKLHGNKEQFRKIEEWKTMGIRYGREERAVDVPDGASAVSLGYCAKAKIGKRAQERVRISCGNKSIRGACTFMRACAPEETGPKANRYFLNAMRKGHVLQRHCAFDKPICASSAGLHGLGSFNSSNNNNSSSSNNNNAEHDKDSLNETGSTTGDTVNGGPGNGGGLASSGPGRADRHLDDLPGGRSHSPPPKSLVSRILARSRSPDDLLDHSEPFSQLWIVLSNVYGELVIVLTMALCLAEVMDTPVPLLSLQSLSKVTCCWKNKCRKISPTIQQNLDYIGQEIHHGPLKSCPTQLVPSINPHQFMFFITDLK
ncbi:unnamed protein product [Trichogramma brassicae]|uniref:Uncharacterized protein n=1 Tax=Trichogramma brassicae TaxID=86971 RepID=A0A6H5IEU3_9HYME|nr:unnamed protein product [Trichogramma brassicae]